MYRMFNDGARYLASASELRWVWPTGEEVLFRFGKEESDYWDYHGQEFPFIGFNELTKQQSPEFYEMMFSCRRSSFRPENYPLDDGKLLPPIQLETFSTTNPFGIGHTWLSTYLSTRHHAEQSSVNPAYLKSLLSTYSISAVVG